MCVVCVFGGGGGEGGYTCMCSRLSLKTARAEERHIHVANVGIGYAQLAERELVPLRLSANPGPLVAADCVLLILATATFTDATRVRWAEPDRSQPRLSLLLRLQ